MLNSKQVLLIMPKYYGYENKVVEALKKLGANVYVIFENIDHINYFYGFLLRNFPRKREEIINSYYKRKIKKIRKPIDYLLIIRGSTVSLDVLEYIAKKASSSYKKCLYQWDSVKNNPNAEKISKNFDIISTFDVCDSEIYGWKYRPLFYTETSDRNKFRKYDVAYICTLHSQRISIYKKIEANPKIRSRFLYMYSERFHYFKQKYIKNNKEYVGMDNKKVQHMSLSLDETNKIMSESNIIVDYTHPKQNGLTMRTIESIGHKCKLITNNKRVLNCDFYNPNNILIYENDDIQFLEDFLKKPYMEIDKIIYQKYHIDAWIKEVLGLCIQK